MTTAKDALDRGDTNQLGALAKVSGLGSVISGDKAYGRLVYEKGVAVAAAAAPLAYPATQLLYARTIGTGAPAAKASLINGAAPSAGQAAPNAGGTAMVFNAETTGTGTCDVLYWTEAPPTVDGAPKLSMMVQAPGFAG